MKAFAFFDVDETLIYTKSMFDFLQYWCSETQGNSGEDFYRERMREIENLVNSGATRKDVNELYYKIFKGADVDLLTKYGQRWFDKSLAKGNFFKINIVLKLKNYINSGIKPVLVSGSMPALLIPIANHLGISADNLICADLEIESGIITGKLIQGAIGEQKGIRVKRLLEENKVDKSKCYAFGDHISDLSMLEHVGYPSVVDPCGELRLVAVRNNWPIIITQKVSLNK